jgi:hypothetical protein
VFRRPEYEGDHERKRVDPVHAVAQKVFACYEDEVKKAAAGTGTGSRVV